MERTREQRLEFLALSPEQVRVRDQENREQREAQRVLTLDQDGAVCQRPGCSHKRVSHGSFDPAGQFVGIGLGRCGADGPDHDTCPCREFRTLAPVPVA